MYKLGIYIYNLVTKSNPYKLRCTLPLEVFRSSNELIANFCHSSWHGSVSDEKLSWTDITHRIQVWYIYLHELLTLMVDVGKYTSPMDPMDNSKQYIHTLDSWSSRVATPILGLYNWHYFLMD